MKFFRRTRTFVAIVTAIFSVILVICAPAFAQEVKKTYIIEGKTLDIDGNILAGVAVFDSISKRATTSTRNGEFSLEVDSQSVLTAYFLGMKTVSMPVNGKTSMIITMESEAQEVDEIVVIGYGTVRKSDMTGAVASLDGEELETRTVSSVEDALRGRIAGVHVSSSDGQPGEVMNIRIRGTGSINASNSPLYVVDGAPMEELDVVPGEIENFEVLKDASATAIYGSRGANGVIIITTKKGADGAPSINFYSSASVQVPVRLIDMMNTVEYSIHRADGRGVFVPAGVRDASSRIKYFDRDGNLWGYGAANDWYVKFVNKDFGETDVDWQRSMLQNTMTYDNRISISGGDDNSTYSIGGNYFKQDGIVLFTGFEKYSARLNVTQQITSTFSMGVNVNAARAFQKGAFSNEQYGTLYNMLGQQPVKKLNFTDEFVDLGGESALYNNNPWYQAKYVKKNQIKDDVYLKAYLDKEFPHDLRLNVSGYYSYKNRFNDNYTPSTIRGAGYLAGGIAQTVRRTGNEWLNENILYYEPEAWGKHRFDAMAGVTLQENTSRALTQRTERFDYEKLGENGLGLGLKPISPVNEILNHRMMSVLGRVNYSYDHRYLFTASLRADGSSRFGANNRWAYFPSGAFAWRFSEESFLADSKVLTGGKLRLSTGISGNTAIPPYQTLPMLDISNYPYDGSEPSLGFEAMRLANFDLKWETSTQYDAGLDLSFWNGALDFTVDAYYKRTRDLLLIEPTPWFTGYESIWSNAGKVDNKGLEITIDGRVPIAKDFVWETSYNMAFNRSKVIYMGESGQLILSSEGTPTSNFGLLREGLPIGLWYGYQTDDLFRSYDEIAALPANYVSLDKTREALRPGAQRYVDQNGDNLINELDRVVLGDAEPDFTGGWYNTFSYKNLRLLVATEFRYGGDIFNATALYLERGAGGDNQTKRYFDNKYRPTLYDQTTGEVFWEGTEDSSTMPGTWLDSTAELYAKDYYIEDGSFFRISDISLSYSLPKRTVKKLRLSDVRLTASIKNAYVFTNYFGYDPDVNSVNGANADLLPGLDNGSYPRTRSFLFNINIMF